MKKSPNFFEHISQPYFIYISVLIIWAVSAILINYNITLEEKGIIGDSFGIITSLFTGLAFSGLLHSIKLQREELKAQREELELTRSELSRTAKANELNLENQILENRISKLPYFNITISNNKHNGPNVTLSNIGQFPALNIEILIVNKYKYNNEPFIKSEFDQIALKYMDESKNTTIRLNKKIHILPNEFYIYFELKNFDNLEEYDMILQYDDILGNNYMSLYNVSMKTNTREWHELTSIISTIPQPTKKIDFENISSQEGLVDHKNIETFMEKWKTSHKLNYQNESLVTSQFEILHHN